MRTSDVARGVMARGRERRRNETQGFSPSSEISPTSEKTPDEAQIERNEKGTLCCSVEVFLSSPEPSANI